MPHQHSSRAALAAVAIAALVIVSPSFFLGQASGHDFGFHLASWMEVAQQWHAGVFFPRWAAGANWGYGEPRFIFYPPLSWCIGAALGLVLPWRIVPGAFIFLCLLLAGFSMHRLARGWMSPAGAVAAAVLYAANPYHLTIVYVRSDFAELLASALFPLAAHYALRCSGLDPDNLEGDLGGRAAPTPWKSVAALAVVYAAIWLANAPAAVVTSYALVLLLVPAAMLQRSPRPLLWGAIAIALGLMLAGAYIVPAVIEQPWVNIVEVVSSGLRPEQNFLYTWILEPEHNLFNLAVSTVAALEIAITGVAAVVARRRAGNARALWIVFLELAAASTALMFPFSGFVWRYAPKLQFVQFTWRWLVPLGVCFAFFLGQIFAASRRRLAFGALFAAILAITGAALITQGWWNSDDIPTLLAGVTSGQGYEGVDEYVTLGGDRYNLDPAAPFASLLAPGQLSGSNATPAPPGRVAVDAWRPNRKIITVDAPQPARLALHLLDYPAWETRVNGVRITAQSDPATGKMVLPLPPGHDLVELRFVQTWDRSAGDALSALASLLLAALLAAVMRKDRRFAKPAA